LKFNEKIKTKGLTLIPTKLYFNHKNRAKVELALCRGKNLHDKRDVLKEKSIQKEIKQQLKNFGR